MKSSPVRVSLRVAVIATTLGVSIGLAGCIQSPTGPATSAGHSAPASNAPTTLPTPSATSTPQKFAEGCNILLTPDQLYDYNPNYVVDTAYSPQRGSIPAAIAADLGQTCGWINETSGSKIEVAITALNADQWAAAKAAAASGTPISTNGAHGFFSVKNGVGSAQLFFGSIWLDVSSAEFATADDARVLFPVVVNNQRTAGG
jgi:hypothetical protein